MDPAPSMGYGTALLQSFLALVAVCVTAWWVFRVAMKRGPYGLRASGRIQVIDRAALDGQRSVYLVRVGGRVLLLGGAREAVTLLAELTDADVPTSATVTEPESFASVLARLRGRSPGGS